MRYRQIGFGLALGLLAGNAALANPTGAQVVNGSVQFAAPNASTLHITNTPGTIINWQGFSIGQGELTRFLQQNANSAVLNRVIGANPSNILGSLLSNGRVFLINANGMVFGPNAVIDTAGFIASTLNITDADFLQGKFRFEGGPESGSINNQGFIRTGPGGEVVLIAPSIENSGIIQTPEGTLILAAGEKVTLTSLDLEGIEFEVQAPANKVVNLGELVAEKGAAGVFAGTIRNSGVVRADGIDVDAGGNIVLSASRSITLDKGSTLTASGGASAEGGNIRLIAQAGSGDEPAVIYQHGDIDVSGATGGGIELVADNILHAGGLIADGAQDGGNITVNASRQILALAKSAVSANSQNGTGGRIEVTGDESLYTSASYSATGIKGGRIQLLGDEVQVAGAGVDVSGMEGGGDVHVGGGYQGNDESVRNAERTLVNSTASITADAIRSGDGGQVIVWADGETLFTGSISSKGGAGSGNGGFVEVSGKEVLQYGGRVDLTAANGELGTLLLDPKNISVSGVGVATVSNVEIANPNVANFNSFGRDPSSGKAAVELNNGNLVLTDYESDLGASDAGAVYIFNPDGTSLIGTILGTAANDEIGSGGVTLLAGSGNFVISSPDVDVLGVNGGAATLHNGTTGEFFNGLGGCSPNCGYGAIDENNSLYGTSGASSGDEISGTGVFALSDGDYVVLSRGWNNDRGAVTYGSGVTGITGPVSTSNSITASSTNSNLVDFSNGIIELSNGNFVLRGSSFRTGSGSSANRGIVALINGATGEYVNGSSCTSSGCGYGAISSANGIRGAGSDRVGNGGLVPLSNGNYVVISNEWDGSPSSFNKFGAVSLMDGATGRFVNGGNVSGISSANSLRGTNIDDRLGIGGVTELANGDYVVASDQWNSETGAVSQMDGDTGQFVIGGGVTGISTSNSVTGGITASDNTGFDLIVLNNGNYVVGSPDAGAATLVNGANGQFVIGGGVGAISSGNSLLMDSRYPFTNSFEVLTALDSGNYLFSNPDNFDSVQRGRVILVNGATGVEIGRVEGYDDDIEMGDGGVHELTNGNYVILSIDEGDNYSGGGLIGSILVDGETGLEISSAFDVLAEDASHDESVFVLSNGNYLVAFDEDSTNGLNTNGTVRLMDDTTGSEIARIEGDDDFDNIGDCFQSSCVVELNNDHFVLLNPFDTVAGVQQAGSVIVVNSITGLEVDRIQIASPAIFDSFGSEGIVPLSNESFVVLSDQISNFQGRIDVVTVGSVAATSVGFTDTPGADATLSVTSIKNALKGGNLILQSNNDFILDAGDDILVSNAGAGGSLTIKVGRSVILNSNIFTDNGDLIIIANEKLANGVSTADRDPGAAVIRMAAGISIDAGTGSVLFDLSDGAGRTGSQALTGMITLTDINANTVTLAGGLVDGAGTITADVFNTGATLAPGA